MLEIQQKLDGHTDRVWTLAWNPSGTTLASSGGDKSIRLWAQTTTWECVSILTESHSKSIRRVCWSPCGRYLASASFDSTVCIWKRNLDNTWTTAVNLEGHESEVKSVAWSSDGVYLASCGRDKSVWIWERSSAEEDRENEDDVEVWDCSDVKNDHTKDVKQVVWHPVYNILASCSYDDTIKLFHKEGEDWACYQTLTSHGSTVWSADFSASGEFLATCSEDKTVRIWKNHAHSKLPNVEKESWKCVSTIQGYHKRTIYDVSWSKMGDLIVSASGDNSLAIYKRSNEDPADQDIFICESKYNEAHDCDINSVAWNPKQSTLLATASDDRSIKIWNYSSDEKGMKPLPVTDEIIQSLKKTGFTTDSSSNDFRQDAQVTNYSVNVTDHSQFSHIIQTLQLLQNQLDDDVRLKRTLEKLFDLSICEHPLPLRLTNLIFDTDSNISSELTVEIFGKFCDIKYKFRLVFNCRSKFRLEMPRRSVQLLAMVNEIFLFEKTGDLYKITPTGRCMFLLGHLFSFADVKFVLSADKSTLKYILSADRDEKIRITKYPDTYEIERYCFGHKNLVRGLYVADDFKFISTDRDDIAHLWDISTIGSSTKLLKPSRILPIPAIEERCT